MNANPFLGVFLHWLGGLASASFYVPFRRVKLWSWETYWLVGGFFSWIIAHGCWLSLMTSERASTCFAKPRQESLLDLMFGVLVGSRRADLWLTMRYLGMSLGMARGAWIYGCFRNVDATAFFVVYSGPRCWARRLGGSS